MSLVREIRKRARLVAPQVLLACIAIYFSYYAVEGDRGIRAWLTLRQDLAEARELGTALARERARLERDVVLLRPDSLDPDMLEERARILLNFGAADDYVVILPKAEK